MIELVIRTNAISGAVEEISLAERIIFVILQDRTVAVSQQRAVTASVVMMISLVARESILAPEDLVYPVPVDINSRWSPGVAAFLQDVPTVVVKVGGWIGIHIAAIARPTLHTPAKRIVTEISPPHIGRPDIHWLI